MALDTWWQATALLNPPPPLHTFLNHPGFLMTLQLARLTLTHLRTRIDHQQVAPVRRRDMRESWWIRAPLTPSRLPRPTSLQVQESLTNWNCPHQQPTAKNPLLPMLLNPSNLGITFPQAASMWFPRFPILDSPPPYTQSLTVVEGKMLEEVDFMSTRQQRQLVAKTRWEFSLNNFQNWQEMFTLLMSLER